MPTFTGNSGLFEALEAIAAANSLLLTSGLCSLTAVLGVLCSDY
jgi:hypothetical protein